MRGEDSAELEDGGGIKREEASKMGGRKGREMYEPFLSAGQGCRIARGGLLCVVGVTRGGLQRLSSLPQPSRECPSGQMQGPHSVPLDWDQVCTRERIGFTIATMICIEGME